jgi:hypothetical protein
MMERSNSANAPVIWNTIGGHPGSSASPARSRQGAFDLQRFSRPSIGPRDSGTSRF